MFYKLNTAGAILVQVFILVLDGLRTHVAFTTYIHVRVYTWEVCQEPRQLTKAGKTNSTRKQQAPCTCPVFLLSYSLLCIAYRLPAVTLYVRIVLSLSLSLFLSLSMCIYISLSLSLSFSLLFVCGSGVLYTHPIQTRWVILDRHPVSPQPTYKTYNSQQLRCFLFYFLRMVLWRCRVGSGTGMGCLAGLGEGFWNI